MVQLASSSVPGFPDVDLMLDLNLLLKRIDVQSNPLNDIPRISDDRQDLIDPLTGLPIVDNGGNVKYLAPAPTGNDDTDVLQEFLDDMGAEAVAQGRPRWVELHAGSVYRVRGLWHPDHIRIDGQGSELLKIANNSGNMFTSVTPCVIRARWVKKNGSWYGSSRFMALKNITLNSGNKDYLSVAEYFNVEHLLWQDVTMIAGLWSLNWTTRIIGRNILIINPVILGATRIYQDGLHFMAGHNIHVVGGYIESGDDAFAFGADQITSSVYCDDEGLTGFSVTGASVLGTRGFGCKVYTAAPRPFAAAPNNYVNTGTVRGGKVRITGRVGQLRNGAWALNNRERGDGFIYPEDMAGFDIGGDLVVGTDGTMVFSAVPGEIVGSPSAMTVADPNVFTMVGHPLTTGEVISFIDIPPDGTQNLVGFYQVRVPTADTFQLSDTAFRSTVALPGGAGFKPWTGGKVIRCRSGLGYATGQDLTLAGGVFQDPAVVRITEVDANGAVLAVRFISRGKYSQLPPTPNSPTGGTGTGVTLHLELAHSGTGAQAIGAAGASQFEFDANLTINDTTLAAATRFSVGLIDDSQDTKVTVKVPAVPAAGGITYRQIKNTQALSRRHLLNVNFKFPATAAAGQYAVLLSNSSKVQISGVVAGLPTSGAAVLFAIGGNVAQTKTITSITDNVLGTEFVFASAMNAVELGDYLKIEGNLMSGSTTLNGFYVLHQVVNSTAFRLKDLDGNVVRTEGLSVVDLGTISLANNTAVIDGLRAIKASGASSTLLVNAASASPHRATALEVKNSDASGVDICVGSNLTTMPVLSVSNVTGFTYQRMVYRGTSVTHNVLMSKSVIVQPSAAVAINAPTNARAGDAISITIIHPASGAVSVTWNAAFRKAADVGTPQANSRASTEFVFDGTVWVQQGGPLTYFLPT